MATFLEVKTRIASELERELTDETYTSRTWATEIGASINDAIKLHRSKAYWFLQQPTSTTKTATTTASNSYVTEPTGLIKLYSLRVTINSQLQPMEEVSFQEMESLHDGNQTDEGQPYLYNRYGARIRIYPTPDDVYTLTFSGLFQLNNAADLSADADTNAWLTDAEILIRTQAKLIMARDYIKDYTAVPALKDALMEAKEALDREHVARTATNRIRARS